MGDGVKVLHVITGMGSGGAESMIMNWYRNIDKTNINFDFLLRSKENIYSQEIDSLGGKVYYMPEFPKRYFSNLIKTYSFFKQHRDEYDVIHVHGNALIYTNVFLIAKFFGIKNRIMHSHSTSTKSKLFLPLHRINKLRIKRLANCFLACSDDAGKWCFDDDYKVITNGIDTNKFLFNVESRNSVREELGIADNFAICHVGRFLEVKNHKFILKVFERVYESNPNAHLVLVGTGPLQQDCKNYVEKKTYAPNVHFLGVRTDIPDVLSASDVFVFPSLYEGLPVSLIEAQASGLFCVASKNVPKESKVTQNITYLPIDDNFENYDMWKSAITQEYNIDRLKANDEVGNSAYNIKNAVRELENLYMNME